MLPLSLFLVTLVRLLLYALAVYAVAVVGFVC